MQTESTKEQNVYKLWLQRPGFQYPSNASDRSWQVKSPYMEPRIAAPTNPIFGVNPVRGRPNLTDRNLRRLTNAKENVNPIHWSVNGGLEASEWKKVKNAIKRRRKELRNNA